MGIEKTLENLNSTLEQLTLTIIDCMKYMNKPEETTVEVKKTRSKKAKVVTLPDMSDENGHFIESVDIPPGDIDDEIIIEVPQEVVAHTQKREVTTDEIIKIAHKIMDQNNGDSEIVKDVLREIGVDKVSQLTAEQRIQAFDMLAEKL